MNIVVSQQYLFIAPPPPPPPHFPSTPCVCPGYSSRGCHCYKYFSLGLHQLSASLAAACRYHLSFVLSRKGTSSVVPMLLWSPGMSIAAHFLLRHCHSLRSLSCCAKPAAVSVPHRLVQAHPSPSPLPLSEEARLLKEEAWLVNVAGCTLCPPPPSPLCPSAPLLHLQPSRETILGIQVVQHWPAHNTAR